jgi:hypothetical protein
VTAVSFTVVAASLRIMVAILHLRVRVDLAKSALCRDVVQGSGSAALLIPYRPRDGRHRFRLHS